MVFLDEKKFNLDGPDRFAYYWHDIRREEKLFSRRQGGGGSVMVWGAFCFHGKSELAFVGSHMNLTKYCEVLKSYLIPAASSIYRDGYIFQQDNASILVSRETKEWLESKDIQVLPWPAKSPDLRRIFARVVYQDGRHFSSVGELKEVIVHSWRQISTDIIQNLVDSTPER